MKAPRPGGDGSYISITGFESNPQGYFRALITVTKLMERIRRLLFLWFFGLFVRSIYIHIYIYRGGILRCAAFCSICNAQD